MNLPIFLLSNVVMYDFNIQAPAPQCCILGYHNAYFSTAAGSTVTGKLQTYMVVNYNSTAGGMNFTGAFPGAPDSTALSKAIGEWINNPTGLNPTPPWGNINQVVGCRTDLAVAAPLAGAAPVNNGVPASIQAIPTARFTYHVQDLAFKSWFYNDTTTRFMGQYSLFGTGTFVNTPAAPCP